MKLLLKIIFLCLFLFASSVLAQEAQKIDEFGYINCEYWMVRLDRFAIEILHSPNARPYIIYYGGQYYPNYKNDRPQNILTRRGEAKTIIEYYTPYLLRHNGIPKNRITFLVSGYQKTFKTEFWLVPEGAKIPELTPTIKPENIKFRKGILSRKELDKSCAF